MFENYKRVIAKIPHTSHIGLRTLTLGTMSDVKKPSPPPEAQMIERLRVAARLSVRRAAVLAGMSEGRWRQIAKGYQAVTRDIVAPVVAPADTLKKMFEAVSVPTDGELAEMWQYRPDVGELLDASQALAAQSSEPTMLMASDPTPLRRLYHIREQIDLLITELGESNAQVTESQQGQGSPQASGESGESGAPIGVSVEHFQAIAADESLTSAERNRRVSALMEQLSVAPGNPKDAGGDSARAGA